MKSPLAIVVAIGVAACLPRPAPPDRPVVVDVAPPTSPDESMQVRAAPNGSGIVVTMKSIRRDDGLEVDASYPHLHSTHPTLGRALAALSDQVESMVRSEVRGFVRGASEGAAGVAPRSFSLRCTPTLLEPPLIGLACSRWSYEGGAHGLGGIDGLSYRIQGTSPWPIVIDDLVDGEEQFAAVAARCLDGLRAQGAAWVLSGELTALDPGDLSSFTLAPEGVTFHFAPYFAGPYAQGSFEVFVPWDEMLTYLPPSSALAKPLRHLRVQAEQTCAQRAGTCMEGCDEGMRDDGQRDCFDSTCCLPSSP